MTDLSTSNLKRLLAETSPGPWEARGYYMDGDPRPDTSCQIFSADGKYLGIVHSPHAALAAAAPDLAQEVLRLRHEMDSKRIHVKYLRMKPDQTLGDQDG